jgi:D-3-phosphoglycerate dehydrogenase
MGFKVVNSIYNPLMDYGEHQLASLDVSLAKGYWRTEEDLIQNTSDADGVICAPGQPWTPRVIRSLSRCRILASSAIGYDMIDLNAAAGRGIVVTNVPDYCIDEVSNQVIALLMALARRLFPIDKGVREKQAHIIPGNREVVEGLAYPVFRLSDQTIGILGFGRIGTAVALKARGLGMRVISHDPYVFGAVMKIHGAEPVDLDTLLRNSDYISINAYLSEETRGMFDDGAFKKMKPTSYLINTARGGIVDQPALVRALQEGRIAGAGLDVTAIEPIPFDDPILTCPNVILTGHSAWYSVTSDSAPEHWHKAMGQIAVALQKKWPIYAVNPEVKQQWLEKWGK